MPGSEFVFKRRARLRPANMPCPQCPRCARVTSCENWCCTSGASVVATEVGRVHLGIVHVFKLPEPKVEKREAMITGLTFLAKEELFARRDTMETWSQICLDSLDRLLL